jgi:hypothetical protein
MRERFEWGQQGVCDWCGKDFEISSFNGLTCSWRVFPPVGNKESGDVICDDCYLEGEQVREG